MNLILPFLVLIHVTLIYGMGKENKEDVLKEDDTNYEYYGKGDEASKEDDTDYDQLKKEEKEMRGSTFDNALHAVKSFVSTVDYYANKAKEALTKGP